MTSNAIKVFIKVRPLIAREKNENLSSLWQITENSIKSTDKQYHLSFDHIYDENRSTHELFDELAKPIVVSALKGINGTIFAYGQTSSGKTHTMMGIETCPGIIPLSVREIFEQIEKIEDRIFLVRVGYIEIYNEKIYDLLDEGKSDSVKIFETGGEVNVKQLELVATSEEEIIEFYETGNKWRRTAETGMNDRSSRSHTIFKITIESREEGKTNEETAVQVSNLNLVDLAGSERADQTKSEGERLKEGGHINKSLLALGNVIRFLSDGNVPNFINYRDSKLTRILSASLGGNAMTSIICTVTPAALEETYSTLIFAQNAKKIKNKPKVNEVMTDQAIMKRMEREIRQLKEELAKSRNCEQLKQQILQREGQFLHSHNMTVKVNEINRRRTWAASNEATHLPHPLHRKDQHGPSTSTLPIFLVDQSRNSEPLPNDFDNKFEEEVFAPSSEVNLDRTLSPGGRDTDTLSGLIHTPREMKKHRPVEDSPNPQKLMTNEGLLERIKFLEDEIQELSDFRKVETHVGEDHAKLAKKLSYANEKNTVLELKVEELEKKLMDKESNVELMVARKECDKAMRAKTEAENILSSNQYEHEIFKDQAKKREEELRKCLAEARDEAHSESKDQVCSLQETLSAAEQVIETLKSHQDSHRVSNEGGDVSFKDRIVELESLLKQANEDRETIALQLKNKKHELATTVAEYDEASTQLVETIQENERLSENLKKVTEELNDSAVANLKKLHKFKLIEEILFSLRDETDLPDLADSDQDSAIQMLMLLYSEMNEMKNSQSEMNSELDKLRMENEDLHRKLPTIQESSAEAEYELKTRCEALIADLEEMKLTLAAKHTELTKIEAQKQNLQGELEEAVKASNQMDETKTALANELNEMKASIDFKDNKIDELEAALSSQASEMTSEISDLKEGLQRLMSLGEENVRLKTVEKEHKRMVYDLTVELAGMQTRSEQVVAARGLSEVNERRIEELEATEKIVQQMETEIALKVETIERLETEVEMLSDKIETLKQAEEEASHFKELNLDMDVQLHELQDQLQDLQQQLDQKTIEIEDNLKSQSTEFDLIALEAMSDEHAEELRLQLQDSLEKIATLEEQLQQEQLKNSSNALPQEDAEQQDRSNEMVEKIEDLDKQLKQARTLQEQSKLELDGLKVELGDLQLQREHLNAEIDELKAQLLNSNLEQESSKTKLEESQAQLEQLSARLEESSAQLEQGKADDTLLIDDHRNQLKEALEKISQLEKQLNDHRCELQEASSEPEGEKHKMQIADLLNKIQGLEQQLIQAESHAQYLEASYKQQTQEVEDKLKDTSEKLLALEEKLKESSALKASHNELVEKLWLKIDALDKELADATKAKENLALQLESQTNEGEVMEILKIKMSELQSSRDELNIKLLVAEEAMKKVEEDLKESQSAAISSSGELEVFKAKFDALQVQLTTKNDSIKILEKYIEDKDQEIKELQKNIETESKESKDFENLKQRLLDLERENEALKVQIPPILEARESETRELIFELESLRKVKLSQDRMIDRLTEKAHSSEVNLDNAYERLNAEQLSNSKIQAEKTNLESKIIIIEEEIKVVQEQLKEKSDELEEVKARYRRRSCDSDKKQQQFELEKSELLQSVGAAEASKLLIEKELNKLKADYLPLVEQTLPQLQAEVDKLKTDLSDHDYTFTVLDEKYQQAQEMNQKLQDDLADQKSQLETIEKENKRLQLELHSLNKNIEQLDSEVVLNNKVIRGLRDERESLLAQLNDVRLVKKGSSPEKRLSNELYASQNQQLLLEGHRVTPSRVGERNAERKTRRQSVHDERRRLSLWERFTDTETQTEDVSEICACSELTQKVKELQIEVRKRDCKVSNLERMAQHNPLKIDVDEMKKSLNREQREHQQTRSALESLTRNINKLESKIAVLSANQKEKKEMITRACQITGEVASKKDKSISEAATGKENVSSNINKVSAIENENVLLKKKLQELEERRSQPQTDDSKEANKDAEAFKEEIEKLQRKYDMTRRLCNLRNDDISGLRFEIAQLKEQVAQLQAAYHVKEVDFNKLSQKYQTVRQLCNYRLDKLNQLRVRLGEPVVSEDHTQ